MGYNWPSSLAAVFHLLPLGCLGDFELSEGLLKTLYLEDRANFRIYFNKTASNQSPGIRVFVSSENATIVHPLLITIQQDRRTSYLSIPYVDNGYSYFFIERTLCPLLNKISENSSQPLTITVQLVTSSHTPIHVLIRYSYVKNINLRLNEAATLTASPSAPAYLFFEHGPDQPLVRVRLSSLDATRNVCAVVSIHKTWCPLIDGLANPEHRGVYQTMRSQAAINVQLLSIPISSTTITDKQQTPYKFFYVVISVLPREDMCLQPHHSEKDGRLTAEVADHFNLKMATQTLIKTINITVESAKPRWEFGVAAAVVFIGFSLFYIIAITWIIIIDYTRYHSHPMVKLLNDRLERIRDIEQHLQQQKQQHEEDVSRHSPSSPAIETPDTNMEDGITQAMSLKARQLYNEGRRDSSTTTTNTEIMAGNDTSEDNSQPGNTASRSPAANLLVCSDPAMKSTLADSSISASYFSRFYKWIRETSVSSRSGRSLPHLHSVLTGYQYAEAITNLSMPTPHYVQYIHKATSSKMKSVLPSLPLELLGESDRGLNGSNNLPNSVDHSVQHSLPTRNSVETHNRQQSGSNDSSKTSWEKYNMGKEDGIEKKDEDEQKDGTEMEDAFNQTGKKDSAKKRDGIEMEDSVKMEDKVEMKNGIEMEGVIEKKGGIETENGIENKNDENKNNIEKEDEISSKSHNGRKRKDLEHEQREDSAVVKEDGTKSGDNSCWFRLCGELKLLSDLDEFEEMGEVQSKYDQLLWYVVAAIILYGIPVFQIVCNYQQQLNLSGNHDLCYFNSLCSFPWNSPFIHFIAFNNLYSNIGYLMLGLLCILITYRRQQMYNIVVRVINNPFISTREERVGVPQHFGIYKAMAVSIIGVGLMSTAYHICPNKINYQYDMTFMYTLTILAIFKLLECRTPDLNPGLHKLLVLMAGIVLFVFIGGVYSYSRIFYILFFIVHISSTLLVSLQVYYHWKISFTSIDSLKLLYNHISTRGSLWPPDKVPQWLFLVITNATNWIVSIAAVLYQPLDFRTLFLSILLVNFILLGSYYSIMKCMNREWLSFRPVLYLLLALFFWSAGIYFHLQSPTNWLKSPAVSRDGNGECVISFFDSHDVWHFSSALALFFSFLTIISLDDNAETTFRDKLAIF